MPTPVRISATDGYALGARRFGDQSAGPYVVIAGATAVKQAYYARFAAWLSLQGFTVLTFDYRGVGESRPARLRGFEATLRDWGEKDLEAVLRFAQAERGVRPLHVVGHSVGGQLLGLAPSSAAIERAVTVASQSGYWGHWRGLSAAHKAAIWYGLIPTVGAALGYVPGALGLGEDLPGGVALEWARWCRHPNYFLGHGVSAEGYERVTAPLRAISLADDDYAPAQAVDWLHALYKNAPVERHHVTPHELGGAPVGHFGFFRSTFQDSLWRTASGFLLDRRLPARVAAVG
ncbi:MAG: alpha/beta fold hydrolase [Myxococcaceae bacterium]|nr:alpha/beta fold hydrolase [Myxococcaceae bacterium]